MVRTKYLVRVGEPATPYGGDVVLADGIAITFEVLDDGGLSALVITSQHVADALLAALVALRDRQVPQGTNRQHPEMAKNKLWKIPSVLDNDGNLRDGREIPWPALPDDLRTFGTEVASLHRDAITRYLGLLRWRMGTDGHHQAIVTGQGREWSLDGVSWIGISLRGSVRGSVRMVAQMGQELERARLLYDAAQEEPLAHELLREAQDVARGNPRAAFIVTIAALETGVKRYVAAALPGTAWLMDEVPSPPIPKMIRDYLPTLRTSAGRTFGRPSDVELRLIREGIEERNTLVHTGAATWSYAQVEDLIEMVRHLLYRMDYCLGQDWALPFSDGETTGGNVVVPI